MPIRRVPRDLRCQGGKTRMHARLLLSQLIFSLEKKPTTWVAEVRREVCTSRKYLKPETSKKTDLLSKKSFAKRERFWQ